MAKYSFPYNTFIYSGYYDGDMRNGKDIAQPDKAGSFGLELIHLYKISLGYSVRENKLYLDAAVKIANTLADHMKEGNLNYSPLPYKVNVFTGETVYCVFMILPVHGLIVQAIQATGHRQCSCFLI